MCVVQCKRKVRERLLVESKNTPYSPYKYTHLACIAKEGADISNVAQWVGEWSCSPVGHDLLPAHKRTSNSTQILEPLLQRNYGLDSCRLRQYLQPGLTVGADPS